MTASLVELERRIATALQRERAAMRALAAPRSGAVRDVAIVGAGQAGLACAMALRREGIFDIVVVDATHAGAEGPWATYARMPTLRTPKGPTGPDAGMPGLTVREWYEARFGAEAWQSIRLIPTAHWMEYLNWIRRVGGVDVVNTTSLVGLAPANGVLRLDLDRAAPLHARKVILATGYVGAGGPRLAPQLIVGLPREAWAHSSDAIDFDRLRGRDVAVVGAGASAFDNAATAAEHGARQVTMFIRRDRLPAVNLVRWMDFAGFTRNFADLPDPLRWKFTRRFLGTPMPPPPETLLRAQPLENLAMRTGVGIERVGMVDGRIAIESGQGRLAADFLILGTGFEVDLARVAALGVLAPAVALWRDRFVPPEADALAAEIGRYPYLGGDFQFLPKSRGSEWVRDVHIVNNAAVPSLGAMCHGINGMRFMTGRLASAIARDLALVDPSEPGRT